MSTVGAIDGLSACSISITGPCKEHHPTEFKPSEVFAPTGSCCQVEKGTTASVPADKHQRVCDEAAGRRRE